MGTHSDDHLELAERVAAGALDAAAMRWVCQGFGAYLKAGGSVPLERCFGLATTPAKLRMTRRNAWLASAVLEVQGSSTSMRVASLVAEYNRFLGWQWRAWRELSEPPAGTSRLRHALFHIARANDGNSLSPRQVSRIVGHVFSEKCPSESPSIES